MRKNNFDGNFAYLCDIGKLRETNEDQCRACINSSKNILLVVSDGMGGHKRGDYASLKVVTDLCNEFIKKDHFSSSFEVHYWLNSTLKRINKEIFDFQYNNEDYKGMGATVCVALIYKHKLFVLNAGDSRCYVIKENKLIQLSEDQTYVNYLVKSGQISKKDALTHPKRHYLTNAIGLFPSFSSDLNLYDYNGETIFLCSDGLYNNVSFNDIEINLNTSLSVEDKAKSLINLANYNGGTDNISVVIWESFND